MAVKNLMILLGVTAVVMTIPTIYFGYSPDSGHLIDIAQNLSEGRGLTTYYLSADAQTVPSRELMWPPLYPMVLAVLLKLGMTAGMACRFINVVSFMAVTLFIFLVSGVYKPRLLSGLAVGLWLVMAVNLLIANYAWSEPLFIALAALLFALVFFMVRFGRYTFTRFMVLGFLAALATLCRFIGITLLLPVIFLGLWTSVDSQFRKRRAFGNVLGAIIGFALLFLPYVFYSLNRTGSALPPGHPESNLGIVHNLTQLINAVISDFAPILIIIGFLLFLLCDFKRENLISALRNTFDIFTITVCVWVVLYLALMLFITSYIGIDEMNTRFVSPVYPFAIFILANFIVHLLGERLPADKITGRGLAILSAAIVIGCLHLAKDEYKKLKEDPSRRSEDGYTHLMNWIESSTDPDDLFIGEWIWEVRFRTGRAVLESVYPSQPDLTPSKIADFVERHGSRFASLYYVYEGSTDSSAINRFVREFGRMDLGLVRVKEFRYPRRPLIVFELMAAGRNPAGSDD